MATFQVSNPKAVPAILYAADYLGKKFKQAQEKYGKPLKAIETEFLDEDGTSWRMSFGPANGNQATAGVNPPD